MLLRTLAGRTGVMSDLGFPTAWCGWCDLDSLAAAMNEPGLDI